MLLVAAAAPGDWAVANGAHAHPAVAAGVGEPRRLAAGRPAGYGMLSSESLHAPARGPGRSVGHALVFGCAVANEGDVRPAPGERYERECDDALRFHPESMDEPCISGASYRADDGRAGAGLVPNAEV